MILSDEHLRKLVKTADEAFKRLTPEAQAAHCEAQRKSWVVGETMLAHPEMTRAEAEALYDRVLVEGILR